MEAMTIGSMASLAATMFILSVVPGPSVVAVAARSIASGISHGLITIMGIVVANLIFVVMAVLGMASVAESMGSFFIAIKLLGSAYLFWMGITLLRAKLKPINVEGVDEPSWVSNFLCGLFITLGAPRAILFYVSFLPAYIDLTQATTIDVGWIMVVASVSVGGAKLVYAVAAHQSRAILQSDRARRVINLAAGVVMIVTGIVLLVRV